MRSGTGRACEPLLRLGLLILFLGVMGLMTAIAQVETTSRISGIVADPSGAVVPGASVIVKNENTGAMRDATTDATGYYSVVSLLPGTYRVTVTKEGFKMAEVTGQTLQVASPARLDFTLHLGATSQMITVSAAGAELITTTTSEVSGTLNQTLVSELPLARQNVFDLLALTPGAVSQDLFYRLSFASRALTRVTTGGGSSSMDFTYSGVFIAGNRDSGANVSIDGSNVQSSMFQQTTQLQTPASILETKVQAGTMNAEFGSGVSAVNIITKSGTNKFHGELYEFLRNRDLNATPFFTNLLGQKLPNYQQNQFGGAIGGPIKRDKLLFFANYEGMRVNESAVGHENVPPVGVFSGDFSDPRIPQLYNPFQYDSVTGLRKPFVGNQIPLGPTNLCAPRPTCADPVTLGFLQKWVMKPNATVGGNPVFEGLSRTELGTNQYNVRLDFLKSAKSTIYGRFSYLNATQSTLGLQPLEGADNPYSSQNMVLHWTKVITPSLVNDLMVSYTRPGYELKRITKYGNVTQALGMKNVGGDPGEPYFSAGSYALDQPNEYINNSEEDNYQLKDDMNYLRGRHSLKFGGEVRQRRWYFNVVNQDQGETNFANIFSQACPAGNSACTTAAAAAGITKMGGSEIGDYILGTPQDALIVIAPKYDAYQTYYGAYIQDSWRATSKLTVNMGLRYEYWRPWLLPHNNAATWDAVNGKIVYALQNPLDFFSNSKCLGECAPLNPGVPRQGYRTGNLDFAPRVGIAYQFLPNTVFRAAGGIFFDGNGNGSDTQMIQAGVPPFGQRAELTAVANQAFPTTFMSNMFPAPSALGIPQPTDNPPDSFRVIEPYLPTATVDQWSASVQRGLGSFWTAEVDYMGSRTTHEIMFMDLNSAHLPQGQYASLSLQQRRIFPQWAQVGSWIPIGWANYNGMVTQLRNREWHGLTLMTNFTWQKGITTSDIVQSDVAINNEFAPAGILAGPAQWIPADSFVAGYNYILPFGHGRAFGSSTGRVVNGVISGWTVMGRTNFSSGSPQPVYASTDLSGVALNRGYPNRICDPRQNTQRSYLQWFNTSCFAAAPFGTWPNTPMGAVTFPGINSWNLSFAKSTRTRFPNEGARLELRVDMFNAFNHTQWGNVNVQYSPTSTSFGQINDTRPPRRMQVALRYFF